MESALVAWAHRNTALAVAGFAVAFRCTHHLLRNLPLPKVVRIDAFRTWKWRNLSVSMVHSLLTGIWAVTSLILEPDMVHKIYDFYTPLSYLLVCVSSGYFVQDACDIIFTGHARGSWEFLLHHFLVLCSFLYTLFSWHYVAGAVVALLVEVNSVTLHMRLMLKLAEAQHTPLYKANRLLNVFTYVFFRLSAQFYLTWYIHYNYHVLDQAAYFMVTMVLMNIMILIYFYRLIRADFFPRKKRHAEQNGSAHGGDSSNTRFLND
ncbi:TLC domain-containing protein 1 [Engraulis encrasicolus]|uniref:TLC domain-containing protein 1 n=1 Tax=Engraulis encrasicolus TaxID=184585 RepID=UPI002FD118F8